MLARLLKASSLGRKRASQDKPLVVIDISRAIKSLPSQDGPERPAESPPETADILGDQAEAAIDALTLQFEGWMRADIEKLCAAWAEAQADDAPAEAYRAVYTCAHNIHGAAGSYGYTAIGRICGSLCTLLTATPPGENQALIELHIGACRAVLSGGPESTAGSATADAVCAGLERGVAKKVTRV